MTLIFVLSSLGLIWFNLVGLGLIGYRLVGDYAVARVASVLVACLGLFFLEHFFGLGSKLAFLPFSTALSAWLVWKGRDTIRQSWEVEVTFGIGLLYCMAWRYAFPSIDLFGEKIPDFVLIHDYFPGTVLPPPDKWFPPFKTDYYYSFQHYSAALLGRWFRQEPGATYQFAYSVISGLITCSLFAGIRRLSSSRFAAWAVTATMVLGGTGVILVADLASNVEVTPSAIHRYIGVGKEPEFQTAFGRFLEPRITPPGGPVIELPVASLSDVLTNGEYHPPLAGFLILAFSVLVIATLEGEKGPWRRQILHGMLASTIPLCLISNTWILILQGILVLAWFVYRFIAGERGHWVGGLVGAGGATALAYPFLVYFLQQPSTHLSTLELTTRELHATPVAWLCVFWPVVFVLALGLLNRERRGLVLYFTCSWILLLAFTEMFYVHDVNGGTWVRFNSSLKWWGWVYAGAIVSVGALNLGSRNRLCRYGSLVVLLIPCIEARDYWNVYRLLEHPDLGMIDGTNWITKDLTQFNMVNDLKARPDGICLDSGITFTNTEASLLPIFANKASFVGWPVQMGIWRGFKLDVRTRVAKVAEFYSGAMDDPLDWLLSNDIRYVFWLQRDNDHDNERFTPLLNKIRSRYVWRQFAGSGPTWCVGYFELKDNP